MSAPSEGDLSAARAHIQRALGIKEKLHAKLGDTWINLGCVVLEQYDFAAARDYFEKALAFFTKNFPKTSGIAIALEDLSDTFHEQGDQATALEYGQRALAKHEEQLGESTDTAEALGGIGDI